MRIARFVKSDTDAFVVLLPKRGAVVFVGCPAPSSVVGSPSVPISVARRTSGQLLATTGGMLPVPCAAQSGQRSSSTRPGFHGTGVAFEFS